MVRIVRPIFADGLIHGAGILRNPSPSLISIAIACQANGNDICFVCDEKGNVLNQSNKQVEKENVEVTKPKNYINFISGSEFGDKTAKEQKEYLELINVTPENLNDAEVENYESKLFEFLNGYNEFAKAKVKDTISNMIAEYNEN